MTLHRTQWSAWKRSRWKLHLGYNRRIRILHFFSLIKKKRASFKMFLIIHDAKTKNRKSKSFGWSFEVFFLCLFSFSEQLSMYVHFSLELRKALLSFMPIAFLVCAFSSVAWQKGSFPVLQFLISLISNKSYCNLIQMVCFT